MGRPIKKSLFGDTTNNGYQITILANVGASAENCRIISQRGTRKYKCQSITTPTLIMDCFLVDSEAAVNAPGKAALKVTSSAGVEYARTLYQYTVKTYAGNTYAWDTDGSGEVIIGQPTGSGAGVDSNPPPVLKVRATVGKYKVTAGNVASPATAQALSVSVSGSGYADGTYTDAKVTGYTGVTAPSVSYTITGGALASASITNFGTAALNDSLAITIPAP